AGRDEAHGLIPRLDGLTDDFKFRIELPKIEVSRRHLRDQSLRHRLPVLVSREKIGACGLGGATKYSEEIQFPGRDGEYVTDRLGGCVYADSRGCALPIESRKQCRSRYGQLALSFDDPLRCNQDVIIRV